MYMLPAASKAKLRGSRPWFAAAWPLWYWSVPSPAIVVMMPVFASIFLIR